MKKQVIWDGAATSAEEAANAIFPGRPFVLIVSNTHEAREEVRANILKKLSYIALNPQIYTGRINTLRKVLEELEQRTEAEDQKALVHAMMDSEDARIDSPNACGVQALHAENIFCVFGYTFD